MKRVKLLSFIALNFLLVSCASMKAPVINLIKSFDGYKYVYITPTSELTSGSSGVYGGKYGVYGGGSTKTINPSDVISGILLKQGYIRLPELKPELLEQTLIVNYG